MATEKLELPYLHLYELDQNDEHHDTLILQHGNASDHLDSSKERAALVGPHGERIELSGNLFGLLETLVHRIRSGQAVQVITYNRELTTQQAAEILNISRQYLVRLLERGDIPFTKTEGSHRRLRLKDVLEYRRRRSEEARASLTRIARASVEMGDYEEMQTSSSPHS